MLTLVRCPIVRCRHVARSIDNGAGALDPAPTTASPLIKEEQNTFPQKRNQVIARLAWKCSIRWCAALVENQLPARSPLLVSRYRATRGDAAHPAGPLLPECLGEPALNARDRERRRAKRFGRAQRPAALHVGDLAVADGHHLEALLPSARLVFNRRRDEQQLRVPWPLEVAMLDEICERIERVSWDQGLGGPEFLGPHVPHHGDWPSWVWGRQGRKPPRRDLRGDGRPRNTRVGQGVTVPECRGTGRKGRAGKRANCCPLPTSAPSYGICATVMLNSPTAPGAKALTPGWYWPAAAGIPVSTPLKSAEPGKNSTHGPVRRVGFTDAVPVITKVPPVASQLETSRLRWHVKPEPDGAWRYCANSQSPSLPDVTPPANSHHP